MIEWSLSQHVFTAHLEYLPSLVLINCDNLMFYLTFSFKLVSHFPTMSPIIMLPDSHHISNGERPAETIHIIDVHLASGVQLGEFDNPFDNCNGRGDVKQFHLLLLSLSKVGREHAAEEVALGGQRLAVGLDCVAAYQQRDVGCAWSG